MTQVRVEDHNKLAPGRIGSRDDIPSQTLFRVRLNQPNRVTGGPLLNTILGSVLGATVHHQHLGRQSVIFNHCQRTS